MSTILFATWFGSLVTAATDGALHNWGCRQAGDPGKVTNDYVDGGTLDVRLATDLQVSDIATSPLPDRNLYSFGI